MEPNPDLVSKIMAGASGSAIATWMARATGLDLFFMFFGGMSAAWFLGQPLAAHFDLERAESAVGFAVGFIAIFSMRKLYSIFEVVKAEDVLSYIKGFFPRKPGG